MQRRWQDGKRFVVNVQDYNGHSFEALAYLSDARHVGGKALRAWLTLETFCPHGCQFITAIVISRAPSRRLPIRAADVPGRWERKLPIGLEEGNLI